MVEFLWVWKSPHLFLLVLALFSQLRTAKGNCSLGSCSGGSSESYNVVEGDTLVVSCEGQSISWCSSTSHSSNFSTSPNRDGNMRSWLVYENINSSFTVECKSSSSFSCVKSINITHISRPSNVRITAHSSTNVEYKTSVDLRCSASGSPSHIYRWHRSGSLVSGGSFRFYKSYTDLSDTGYYTCEVCNWAGCSTSSNVYLNVTAPHPTISSLTANNRKIIAKSGTQLRLECTARGRTRALQFSWTLNGSTSRLPSSSGPQYSSGTHSRSTLTIPSPRAQYSGNYACIANNTGTGETDSQMIAIIVIDPPQASVRVQAGDPGSHGYRSGSTYSALNGTSHQFTCQSSGSPPLSSQWDVSALNGNSTHPSSFSTVLTHSSKGRYVCVVNNTEEKDLYSTDSLNVKIFDPPVLRRAQSTARVQEGMKLSLKCSVTKHANDPYSLPRIQWRRPSTSGFTRAPESKKGLERESKYSRTATRSDNGTFTCTAQPQSGGGELRAEINVTVFSVPDSVRSSSIQVTERNIDSISLSWTAPNSNNAPITEYRVRVLDNETRQEILSMMVNQPQANLTQLQPFTAYYVQIEARNEAGYANSGNGHTVQTLTEEEVTVRNMSYSEPVHVGSSYTVEIRWLVDARFISSNMEGYRATRWLTSAASSDNITIHTANASCGESVEGEGSRRFCHRWEGFRPGSHYRLSLEILYNYGIQSSGVPRFVNVTIPPLPEVEEPGMLAVGVGVGVVMGVLLAAVLIAVVVIVILIACRRRIRNKDTDMTKDAMGDLKEEVESPYVIEDYKQGNSTLHYEPLNMKTMESQEYTPFDFSSSIQGDPRARESSGEYEPFSLRQASKKGGGKRKTSEDVYMEPDVHPTTPPSSSSNPHQYANLGLVNTANSSGSGGGGDSGGDGRGGGGVGATPNRDSTAGNNGSPAGSKKNGRSAAPLQSTEVNAATPTPKGSDRSSHTTGLWGSSSKDTNTTKSPAKSSTSKQQPLVPPTQQPAPSKQQPLVQPTQQTSPSKQPLVPPTQQPAPSKQQPLVPSTQQPAPSKQKPLVQPTQQPAPSKQQPLVPPTQQPAPSKQQPLVPPTQQPAPSKQQPLVPPTQQPAPSKQQPLVLPTQQPAPSKQQPLVPPTQHPGPSKQQPLVLPTQQPAPSKQQPLVPPTQHPGPSKQQPLVPPTQQTSPSKQPLLPPTQQSAPSKQQPLVPPTQQPAPSKQQPLVPPTQQPAPSKQPLVPPKQQPASSKKQPLILSTQRKSSSDKLFTSTASGSKPQTSPKGKKQTMFGGGLADVRTSDAGNKNTAAPSSSVAELRKKLQNQLH